MPSDGYTGCTSGRYARKHNPWVNFTNVPSSSNLRFSRFPANYSALQSASFDSGQRNRITTVFYGRHVRTGSYSEHITHDNVLRTVEDAFGLPCVANSCNAVPITDVWQ